MRRFRQRSLGVITTWLLGAACAFADAKASAYVKAEGTCSNGSDLWVVGNSDNSSAIVVTVKRTTNVQGTNHNSTFEESLDPGQEKPLGCAIQTPAPLNVQAQFTWQVQDAHYK